MKTSEPKDSEDLDAGWDTSDDVDVGWDKGDHRASSPSVRQINRVAPPVTDDLDLAWDTSAPEAPLSGQAREAAEPAKQKQSRKKPALVKVAVVAAPSALPATPPPHKLTKKERRDLERQQRAYSAKKQVELKRQRKEQRRAASLNEPSPLPAEAATPPVGAKLQSAAKAKSRRKSKVRRPDRPEPLPNQQAIQGAPRAVRRGNQQAMSQSPDRDSQSDYPEVASESKPHQRHMALWTIVIVIVVLTLLFFLQKR